MKPLLCSLCALLFLGCSTDPMSPKFAPDGRVRTARYDSIARAPKASIEVFRPGDVIPHSYRVFAFLQADGEYRQEAELLTHLINQARHLGADGLVLLDDETISQQGVRVGQISEHTTGKIQPNDRRTYRANAIVWKAD